MSAFTALERALRDWVAPGEDPDLSDMAQHIISSLRDDGYEIKPAPKPPRFSYGNTVRYIRTGATWSGRTGKVLRHDREGRVIVQMEGLQVPFHEEELERVPD